MIRALTFTGLVLFVATTVSGQPSVYRSAYHDFRVVTVADGFEFPWSIAFLCIPPRRRHTGHRAAGPTPHREAGEIASRFGARRAEGLRPGTGRTDGCGSHPDFAANRLIYLSYSKSNPTGTHATTAVVRARFENDRLADVEEIFEAVTQGRGHYGSRLAFDQDDFLFITLGDRQAPPRGDLEAHQAQDRSNHHGTTIRLHDDGRVPVDNPFVDERALPEIWSYGHRNEQGLAIHPETGDVWINEHGPQGRDELNLLRPGANYGWPVIGYGVNYRSGSAIHEGTHRDGMESPVHVWVPSIRISGLLVYTGDRFPEWRGNLFAVGMSGQQLARITLDGQQVVTEETLVHGTGRVRDVRQGPDGYIYLAIEDDDGAPTPVVRLEPVDE